MFNEKSSRTFQLTNALVTVHEWSAGTSILNIVSTKDEINRASVWIAPAELRLLGEALIACAEVKQ